MSGKLWDVLVIGAGPAGLAAVRGALESGLEVAVLDRASGPRARLGSGVLSAGTVDAIEDRFRVSVGASRTEPGEIAGARLHLSPQHSYTRVFERPACLFDRGKLEEQLQLACGAPLFRGCEVRGLTESADAVRLDARLGGEPFEPSARVVIDASGREFEGLPARVRLLQRQGVGSSPRFVGRVLLEARVSDPGWHELLVGRDFVARFTCGPGGVVAEMELRSSSIWKSRWAIVVQFLTGPRGIHVEREVYSSFGWLRKAVGLSLGGGRVLRVGDAAGVTGLLGTGVRRALDSGFAAGRAASYVDHSPEPLAVYRRDCRAMFETCLRERSPAAFRRADWRAVEDGPTMREMLLEAPLLFRRIARRSLCRSIERWLD